MRKSTLDALRALQETMTSGGCSGFIAGGFLARKKRKTRKAFQPFQAPVHEADEKGHFVTIRGRPVFIGGSLSKSLDTLKPKIKPVVIVRKVRLKETGKIVDRKFWTDEKWLAQQSRYKFARVGRMIQMDKSITSALKREMSSDDPQKKSVAVAIRLMQETGMRPSTTEGGSTAGSSTHGLTSLQKKHVKYGADGSTWIKFVGKAGVAHSIKIQDAALGKAISDYAEAGDRPRAPLFTWETPTGRTRRVTPDDVLDRVKKFNPHFKSKDFRTAYAMRLASESAEKILARKRWPKIENDAARLRFARKIMREIATPVSKKLGNTPAVAMQKYINPELFEYVLRKIGFGDVAESTMYRRLDPIASEDNFDARYRVLISLFGRSHVQDMVSMYCDDDSDDEELENVGITGSDHREEHSA